MATDECPVALKPSPQTLKKEEGLMQLPGFAIPSVLPSALPSSCNKGQHSVVGDERGVGTFSSPLQSSRSFPSVDRMPSEQSGCANCQANQSQHLGMTRHAERQAKKTEADSEDNTDGGDKKEPEPVIIESPVIRLFQGKPDKGVMKIRFTIHSTVTRRQVKGSKGHWPIEQASVLLSQPEVTFADTESKSATTVKSPVLLQENHSVNVIDTPEKSSEDVPKQSSLQKVSPKRPFRLHGYRTGLFRPHKPHRKSKRLRVHKIVQIPLSPVKEEITEEETLETLLAKQNVDVDSDESLDDLLLSPDNIFESLYEMRKTLYDQFDQKESTQQQAVRLSGEPHFVMPKVGGSQLSYSHKDGHSRPMSFQFRDLHLECDKIIAKNLASGQTCPMPQTTENSTVLPVRIKRGTTRKKKMGLTEVTKALYQEDLGKQVLEIGVDPLFISAPLAELEDLEYADETCPTTIPSLEDEEKPVLCSQGVVGKQVLKKGIDPLTIAASLAEEDDFEYADGSSLISSPPVQNGHSEPVLGSSDSAFVCISADFNSSSIINEPEKTMQTDPQRVKNFESPLPGTSINPFGEQAVPGVALSWPQSNSTQDSQNLRVLTALNSVTTELVQATLPEWHKSLISASNSGLASDQQVNNVWISVDSQSNENLHLDPLSQAGSENTNKQVSIPSSEDDAILKMPMSFSEFPPKIKKDFLIDEGPLQTSSPKLGRRQDSGSFKIYQSKMGKSEETLEAVACLDQQNQLAGGRRLMPRRSKSFPRNLGSIRSRETMLDDTPLQGSNDRERKGASSLHKGVSSEGENSQAIEANQQSIQKVVKNSSANSRHVLERALSWSEESSREKENYPPSTDTANYPLGTKEYHDKEEWKEGESPRRRHRRAQKDDDAPVGEESTNEKELGLHWSGKKRRRRRRPLSQEQTGVSTEKLDTVDVGTVPEAVGQQDEKTEKSHLHQNTVIGMQKWSDPENEVRHHQNTYSVIDNLKDMDHQQMPEGVEHRDKQIVETGTFSDINIVPADASKLTSLATLKSSNINLSANVEQSEIPENKFYVEGDTEFPAPPAESELLFLYEESGEKPENDGDKLLSENCNVSKPEPVPAEHKQETLDPFFPTIDDPKILDYSNDFFTIQGRKPSKEVKDRESEPIYAKVIPRSERLSRNSSENKSLLVKDLAETSSQQHVNSVTKKTFEESTQARAPKLSESELNIMDYNEEDAPRVRRRRKSKQSEMEPAEERKKNSFREASFRPLSEGWIRNEGEDTSEDAPRMRRRKHKDAVKLRNSDPPVTAQISQSGKHFRNDTFSLNLLPKLHSSMTEPRQLGRKTRSQDTLNSQLTVGEEKESSGVPSESPVVKKVLKNVLLCVNAQGHDKAVKKAPKANSLRERKQPVDDTLPEMKVGLPHSVPAPHLMKLDFVKEPRRSLHSERGSTSSSDSLYRDGFFDKSLEMKAPVMNFPRDKQRQASDNLADGTEDEAHSINWNKPSDMDNFGVEDNKQRKDSSEPKDISHHGEAGAHVKDCLEVSQKLTTDDKLQDVLSDVNPQDPYKEVKKPQFQEEEEIVPSRIRAVSFTDGYTPTLLHLPSGVQLGDSLTAENFVRVRANRARTHSFGSDIKNDLANVNPLTHEPSRSRAWHSHQVGLSQSHHGNRPRSHSHSGVTYSAHSGRRRRSRIPSAGDNRIYQPRPNHVRGFLLSEHPSAAPSEISTSSHTTMLADDNFYSDANNHGYANGNSIFLCSFSTCMLVLLT